MVWKRELGGLQVLCRAASPRLCPPWPCSWLACHLGSEASSGREGCALGLSREIGVSVSLVYELCGDLV